MKMLMQKCFYFFLCFAVIVSNECVASTLILQNRTNENVLFEVYTNTAPLRSLYQETLQPGGTVSWQVPHDLPLYRIYMWGAFTIRRGDNDVSCIVDGSSQGEVGKYCTGQ